MQHRCVVNICVTAQRKDSADPAKVTLILCHCEEGNARRGDLFFEIPTTGVRTGLGMAGMEVTFAENPGDSLLFAR